MENILRDPVAIDWAKPGSGKLKAVEKIGNRFTEIEVSGDLLELISSPILNSRDVILEATSESFIQSNRIKVVDAAKNNDVRLFTINPRQTANFRSDNRIEKDDLADAIVIYRIATETKVHLGIFKNLQDMPECYDDAADSIAVSRYTLFENADDFLQFLPKPSEVPEELMEVLVETHETKKKGTILDGYNKSMVVPMAIAAYHCAKNNLGRKDFDRMVGAYGLGYPSLLRSNFYKHLVTGLEKQEMGIRSFKIPLTQNEKPITDTERKTGTRRLKISERPFHKQKMKVSRKASRWIFYQVKQNLK